MVIGKLLEVIDKSCKLIDNFSQLSIISMKLTALYYHNSNI
ncbi:hypothetical protein [Sporosarcina sp. Te-1]|nr:hypothetical protein [Sporosarcina sp. Te-1]